MLTLRQAIKKSLIPLVCLIGISSPAIAVHMDANSGVGLSNLRFSSTNPSAQLFWVDDWFGTISTHAYDSNSVAADDVQDYLGIDGLIDSDSISGNANGYSLFSVDPTNDVIAQAQAQLQLDVPNADGDSLATSDFDNFFVVEGGTFGDLVEITFELDYDTIFEGNADVDGYYEVYQIAELYITDTFTGMMMMDDFYDNFAFGSDSGISDNNSGTLTITTTLGFGEEYYLFAGTLVDVYGETRAPTAVTEPATLPLLTGSLLLLGWRARRQV